jgi:long-chain acyl-CoA synthetase
VYITGRLKEIIVLANGKKIPPAEMELAIMLDPLFEQVLVVGEARPFLSVLTVPNPDQWADLCKQLGLDPNAAETLWDRALLPRILDRIAQRVQSFPGFAQIRRVSVSLTPWSVNNVLLTPTTKLKRQQITAQFQDQIEGLYAGH